MTIFAVTTHKDYCHIQQHTQNILYSGITYQCEPRPVVYDRRITYQVQMPETSITY